MKTCGWWVALSVIIVGGLTIVQPAGAQSTGAVPHVQAVYGGTVGTIAAVPVPGEANKSRLFISTDSPNSVYYTDVDHSLADPFATNNCAWQVVPDMDANANHGTPWWLDVHPASARMFAACDDGLFSCTIAAGSLVTNLTGQMAFVLIESNTLFAISGGVPESPKKMSYGTLDASGILTLGADLGTTFSGSAVAAVHPVNSKLYVLEKTQTNFALYKSTSNYDAFSATTTFAPVSVPAGLGWVASQIGIGPDGRLFLGGVNTNLQIAFSTNDGTSWATADTGSGMAGGGIGLNITCNGSAGSYEVYYGGAASSNKGGVGTWAPFPRGGQRIPPFSHANAGCVEVDPINAQVIYLTTDKGLGASTNVGVDCFELNQGLTAVQINDLDMSASKDIAWLASKAGIRRATNFRTAPVWTDGEFPNAIVNCVAMEPSDASGLTAYAGSALRVYKTTTGGGTNFSDWTILLSLQTGDPGVTNGMSQGNCKTIKVDGSNIFVGFIGESGAHNSGVFYMSPDSGASWNSVATNMDVNDIVVNTESGVRVAYLAVGKSGPVSGGTSDGGIYRYVPGPGITRVLTNSVDIRDLAVDSAGGIYASGAEINTDPGTDPNRYHVALFYQAPGASTWTMLSNSGLPNDLSDSQIVSPNQGPVMTVGKDSSSNDVPILAVVRTLYCLPSGAIKWSSLYTYPNGTQIKVLYWDELLVGTTIGLFDQAIQVAPDFVEGDIDGDRLADPFWPVRSNILGMWTFWLSSVGYLPSGPYAMTVPGGEPVRIADFDGDGLADPVMVANGGWTFWFSSGGYLPSGPYVMSVPGGDPVAGDFDGDRLADPAMVANGGWTLWLSSIGYLPSGPYIFSVPGTDVTPLAGDFDGDRLADPVMVVNGAWTLWLSSGGYLPSGPYIFSVPGTEVMPMTGDFDGDGLADPVMVVNHNWTLWLSSGGYLPSGPYAFVP